MNLTMTGKEIKVTDAIKEYVEKKLCESLSNFLSG